jgi:superfamily II DNA/RNA helicase
MKAGVPSVELHGNLSQSARARNLSAFSSGRADTLVATDIAARGIHVDDVSLVIHADPPEEHKAYLHRSGRTARAGASGTVVTLMTDKQRRSVRALTKSAGITPITTKVDPSDPFLAELAPGERVFREAGSFNVNVTEEARSADKRSDKRSGKPQHGKPRFDRNGRGDGPRSYGDKSKRGPRKFEGAGEPGRGPKPANRGGKPYGKSGGSAGKNRNQDRRQNQSR